MRYFSCLLALVLATLCVNSASATYPVFAPRVVVAPVVQYAQPVVVQQQFVQPVYAQQAFAVQQFAAYQPFVQRSFVQPFRSVGFGVSSFRAPFRASVVVGRRGFFR